MSKVISNPSGQFKSAGYSLVELMVAVTLSLLLMGMAFNMIGQLYNTADLASTMGDVNENLRAAVNAVSRDLSTAGSEIPLGGIPIPNGGTATAINRPGPGGLTFPGTGVSPGTIAIPVITPGDSLGPTCCPPGNLIKTDIVTMISVDPTSLLDQSPVTAPGYSVTAGTVTINTGTCGWGSPPSACPPGFSPTNSQVSKGQLIMLSNANGSCLLTATDVNLTTGVITFTHGDPADALGVNQFSGPASGTMAQLQTGGVFPSTTAYSISMVTYYLDATTSPTKLMRQYGMGAPQALALGINVMQFSYSLSPPAFPTDPNDYATTDSNPPVSPWTTYVPNQIRKVNLWMIAESDHKNRGTGQPYTKSIALSIVVQNLAYFNKY